jgi:predicted transposase YdaD
LGDIQDFSGQEAMMALSEAFLAWEQQTQERIRQEVSQEERQEERQAIARRLLQQGLPIEAIAQATELSIAEIQSLQRQQ